MATNCVLCNEPVSGGRILCDSCDKPRRKPAASGEPAPPQPPPIPQVSTVAGSVRDHQIVEIMDAGRVAALVIRGGNVVTVTETAMQIFPLFDGDITAEKLRSHLSIDVGHLVDGVRSVVVEGRPRRVRIISIEDGGKVVVFEPFDQMPEPAAGLEFIREAVVLPLRSLSQSLAAAGSRPGAPHLFRDAASVIEQSLSTLELSTDLAGDEEESDSIARVFTDLRDRFQSIAQRKRATIRVDESSAGGSFSDTRGLGEALAIYVENSLRYVPEGGQTVLGVRTMDHKGSPVLLFFVMDNGPLIPEEYREVIFDPGFVWDPTSSVRAGKDLDQCRRFARKHGGKAWVESRTGKACTFFLSVPSQS